MIRDWEKRSGMWLEETQYGDRRLRSGRGWYAWERMTKKSERRRSMVLGGGGGKTKRLF